MPTKGPQTQVEGRVVAVDIFPAKNDSDTGRVLVHLTGVKASQTK